MFTLNVYSVLFGNWRYSMNCEISIIVPVYNLEHLLPKCIDSILTQTFTNFELILVDDGSTDNSGNLCDEYAKLDSRIKVIHKKNGGIASARNAGLDVAEGKYIGFVDNDDYINQHMFEKLYKNAIIHSSDIVVCDYLKVDEKQYTDIKKFDEDYKIKQYDNIDALNQLYTPEHLTFICPWNKLYKSSLFREIRYEIGNIHDDESVVHKILYASYKITYIQTGLYYYVQRKKSQMNSPFNLNRLRFIYTLYDRMIFFQNNKLLDLHQKAIKHYMDSFFVYYYMAKINLKDVNKDLQQLKRTFHNSLYNILKHKELSRNQKLGCVIFCISPKLFELIRDYRIKHL